MGLNKNKHAKNLPESVPQVAPECKPRRAGRQRRLPRFLTFIAHLLTDVWNKIGRCIGLRWVTQHYIWFGIFRYLYLRDMLTNHLPYFARSSRSPQETEPLLDIRDCVARRRRLRKRPSRRRFRPTRRHPDVTYIRGERLGSGSFGTVFQATRSSDQRQVGGHHTTRRRIFTIELDHAMYPWFSFV